jgi:hypothetical protein
MRTVVEGPMIIPSIWSDSIDRWRFIVDEWLIHFNNSIQTPLA